jgi:membrane protein implicated in regulation of membrane protease activity
VKKREVAKTLYGCFILAFGGLFVSGVGYFVLPLNESVWLKRGIMTLAVILFTVAVVKLVVLGIRASRNRRGNQFPQRKGGS